MSGTAGHPGHSQQLFFARKQASLLVTAYCRA
jgi:hypothetical protein